MGTHQKSGVWGWEEERRIMTDMLTASCTSSSSQASSKTCNHWSSLVARGNPRGSLILKAVTEAPCPRALIDSSALWEVTGQSVCSGGSK